MPGAAVSSLVEDLRDDVFDGRFRPGDRLDEVTLGRRFGVSRNTLREAFRVLAQDHLVEHLPNRGVFVRRLSVEEARDVYRARRIVECGALRDAAVSRLNPSDEYRQVWDGGLRRMKAALEASRSAEAAGDWDAVGSANSAFHLALVALAGNHVIDRTMRHILTEMRLLFLVVASAREVHEPYIEPNAQIAGLVEMGELVRASVVLEDYLFRAEAHLVSVYEARTVK